MMKQILKNSYKLLEQIKIKIVQLLLYYFLRVKNFSLSFLKKMILKISKELVKGRINGEKVPKTLPF